MATKTRFIQSMALLGAAVLLCSAMVATAAEKSADPNRFILTKVRMLPKPGSDELLAGTRITGSNEGPTNSFVELVKISKGPTAEQWLEVAVPAGRVWRFVKIESAKASPLALAEIEFYSAMGRLKGTGFGTSVAKGDQGNSFDKALDGDSKTSFASSTDNSYVGIDLGREAQAPMPRFNPPVGAYAKPQKVELSTWPPVAMIRFTTDGSAPTATHGEIYRGPIAVDADTSIAAAAFGEGLADSEIALGTYLFGPVASTPPIRSYHIGNSLTDTVNGFLEQVATSAGKNLYYMRKTIPGCGIQGNWQSCGRGFASPEPWANDYKIVFERKVDHLFLQPFPNPPGLKDDDEAGGNFIAAARQHNPDVQPWLYAQWPAWDSWQHDAHCVGAGWMKPPWFPPNRKPANWEEAMANKMLYYGELFSLWNQHQGKRAVRLCPGGPALVRLKHAIEAGEIAGISDFRGEIFSDAIHLARPGRYLVALVHYACLFGESPEGRVTFANSGLSKEQAARFQRIAWETVLKEPRSGVQSPRP